MSTVIGAMEAYLKLNIDDFEKNLKEAKKQVESVSAKFDVLTAVGDKMTDVGNKLTLGLTTPIIGLGAACVKTTSDFDSTMSKVSAISGATGEDLQALRDKAKEMGAVTKFSAGEAADAFTFMAMAGWDAGQMIDGIAGIMDLAAADGLDLATTSDIVTDALTAFGLKASDSAHFADVLAKASSSANTNVSMLGESFKYVAPVAGAMGYSVEDVAVALGLMANSGIKAGQAGTAMRAALTRMAKPTDNAAALMEKYNLSITNSDGSMKSLAEVMVMLRNNMGDLTEAEQIQAATTIFGQEAMSGMLAIVNASDADFDKLTQSINNADGTAKKMAETLMNNLSGKVEELTGGLETLAISFGELIVPVLIEVVAKLQTFVDWLNSLDEGTRKMILTIAAVVAAIGPVLTIVGKTISTFGKMGSAINNMSAMLTATKTSLAAAGTSIGAIVGPILAVVAVIAVLVAAFKHLWDTNEQFRESMTAIWEGIVAKVQEFCQGIVDRLNSLGFDFENITEVLKAIWDGFCNFLAPVFEGVFSYISLVLSTTLDVILGIVDVFISIFKGDWQGAWDAVKGIFETMWNGLVAWFGVILNTLKGVADVVLGWFGTNWETVWTSVSDFFVGIWNSIVAFFQGIATWFQTTMTNIGNFFTNIWTSITTTVSNIVSQFVTTVQTYFGDFFTAVSGIFEGVKTFFIGVWEAIKNFVGGIVLALCDLILGDFDSMKSDVTNVLNNLKNAFSTIWNGIKTTVSSVVNAIASFLSGAWNAIKNTATSIWNSLKSSATSIFNGIKSALTSAVNSAKSAVVNGFNAMKTGVRTAINNVKTTIKNGFNSAVSFIKGLGSQAATWGSHMVQGFANGVKSALNGLLNTVRNLANQVRSFLHFTRPDRGPLRDYETWMPDMVQGLSKTLDSAAPGLIDKVKALSGDMANVLNGGNYQVALAGAGANIRAGGLAMAQNDYSALSKTGHAEATSKTEIIIERIEVRDDNDLDMLTQGLYNKQDQNLRALGRRSL